ncbi:MAG: ABC transporter permease [Chloroflexota bacterium]
MNRVLSTMKNDVTVQVRNRLYQIGIGVAFLLAGIIWRISSPEDLAERVPVFMLLVLGGSTLLYVAGMILFEKEEGTLSALIVSPLTVSEYLISKIVTLTALATLEGTVTVVATVLLMGVSVFLTFNGAVLLLGMAAIGVVYTLIGIVLVVRYKAITDFLVPVLFIASVLQAPAFHFSGLLESYAWYVIPTTAQVLIMSAAWEPLAAWEWIYALVYTALTIGVLYVWSLRAFDRHIVMRLG